MKTYTYEEVLQASKDYFSGDELAAKVFVDKYALRNNDNEILELTPTDMHHRLAAEFARVEAKKYKNTNISPLTHDEIFGYFDKFKRIVCQGSPMYGIGNNYTYQSLGNCFTLGEHPLDSYGGIMYADQMLAHLYRRRCGAGLRLDNIRPKGLPTKNAARTTDGIYIFMERFSNTTREVAMSGRRGANWQGLSIHHPEIETFINAKKDLTKITGSNISVLITDEFMEALRENKEYQQRWPVDSDSPTISRMVSTKKIWDQIIDAAWGCIAGHTLLSILYNNTVKILTVKELVKNFNQYNGKCKILSLNTKTETLEYKPIINAWSYKNNKTTYDITISGKSLTVTEDHLFYYLDNNHKIQNKPIKDFKINEHILIQNKTTKNISNNNINLLDIPSIANMKNYSISGNGLSHIWNNKIAKNILGKTGHKYKNESVLSNSKRLCRLPVWAYIKLKQNGFKFNENLLHIRLKQEFTFPLKFNITNELSTALGLWLAEGDYTGGASVRFSIHKNEESCYKDTITTVCQQLQCKYQFVPQGENWGQICIHSTLFKHLVSFLMKHKGQPKFIHEIIHSLSIDNIACFIKGFFSGDGSISGKTIDCGQANQLLLQYMQILLLRFGIHSKVWLSQKGGYQKVVQGKLCNVHDFYKLSIYNIFNDKYKSHIGFLQPQKHNRIITTLKSNLFGIPYSILPINTHINSSANVLTLNKLKNKRLTTNHRTIIQQLFNKEYHFGILTQKTLNNNTNNVYDITVKDNHTFVLANGIILSNSGEPGLIYETTAQKYSTSHCYGKIDKRFLDRVCNPCSEIVMGYDSCRLMLINLYYYVNKPFSNNSSFKHQEFYQDCKIAQQLMDDMVDLEIEKIDKIIKKVKSDPEPMCVKQIELDMWKSYKEVAILGRRTGLGITGLGDTLAAIGITYGSDESIKTTEKIYKSLALASMESSCEMAKELGSFSMCDKNIEQDNIFMNRIFKESNKIKKLHGLYGRRNISLTTTSPAGSVSLLTQTTSGIEPVFMLEYTRRRKLPNDTKKYDFVDQSGDKWEHNNVLHHGLKTWMRVTGEKDISKSPYYKATANEINWKNSVLIQSVAQKWLTHSISKTCNLPNNVTKELISEIYLEAYKSKCKGFTVYRDGCRTGVLIDKQQEKAKKRPKTLNCDVHHITANKIPYFVLVGLEEDKPYEVFAGQNGCMPRHIKHGKIIRMRKGIYKTVLDDKGEELELSPMSAFYSDYEEALTRMVSTALRHDADIHFVVEQLEKTKGNFQSFGKAIARALKKYIPDGTKVDDACQECGTNSLVRESGCVICTQCGYSKCS